MRDDVLARVCRWADLDSEQAAVLWVELIAWVNWFRRRYVVTGSDAVILVF